MWSKLLRAILVPLVSFILLGPGNAGRMSDFARRKGFGAHLASNDWEEARTTPWGPDDFRFLTPKTTREEYPLPFDLRILKRSSIPGHLPPRSPFQHWRDVCRLDTS
jgi:hypothetical protein